MFRGSFRRAAEVLVALEELDYIEDRLEYTTEDFESSYPYLTLSEVLTLESLVKTYSRYEGTIDDFLRYFGIDVGTLRVESLREG